MAMMRTNEARRLLQKVTHPHAWLRRVREGGRYVYVAGVGGMILAYHCYSPEQAYSAASLEYDRLHLSQTAYTPAA